MITILLEITLVLEESKKLIVKYIADYNGNPTKNQVIEYMNSHAPAEYRTSRVTTLSIINELDGDRIRVMKGGRRGQGHHLSLNDKSQFDWLMHELSKIEKRIEKMKHEEPEMRFKIKDGSTKSIPSSSLTIATLCVIAYHTSRRIKNESDQRVLNDKILQLMIKVGIKNLEHLSEIAKQWVQWRDLPI